ncbi:MAG: hypothetical protein AAB890_01505 [Patescibacteria group bacterium]
MGRNIHWTNHAQEKMRFYHLSEQRVRRALNSPKRVEEGIAPNTVAMMQVAGSKKHPYEIWVMIQKLNQNLKIKNQNYNSKFKNSGIKIISAWKYPGRTKPGEPLPEEILRELRSLNRNDKKLLTK